MWRWRETEEEREREGKHERMVETSIRTVAGYVFIRCALSFQIPTLPLSVSSLIFRKRERERERERERDSNIQSDLYYPRYLGVLNFGLKNRG